MLEISGARKFCAAARQRKMKGRFRAPHISVTHVHSVATAPAALLDHHFVVMAPNRNPLAVMMAVMMSAPVTAVAAVSNANADSDVDAGISHRGRWDKCNAQGAGGESR
jgi:hypothetical protein